MSTSCILSIFFIYNSISAQENKLSDYIVTSVSDTLYGKVSHLNEKVFGPKFYKKIRFTDQMGKLKKIKRKNILAFKIDNEIFEGFWLKSSSQNGLFGNLTYIIDVKEGERHFLKVLQRDKLSHYRLLWYEQGESLEMSMDLFKKQNENFFIRADQGILGLKRKSLVKYFGDCIELLEQLENKKIKKAHEVVDFYNTRCIQVK
jgi:hypothetical protein